MENKQKDVIAIVVPVYNEAKNLHRLHERLAEVFSAIPDCEPWFLLINDGSTDDSWDGIRALASRDPRVTGVCLSRNFGKEIALTAGVEIASVADAVICIDADLQHPPEIIPRLIEEWRAGYEIVATIRHTCSDYTRIKRYGSRLFYALMQRMSDLDAPANTTDFRLLDRKVAEALSRFSERTRIFRGIIDWMGFKKTFIPFDAPARSAGEPTYSYAKLFRLAINSLTTYSQLPLRLSGYLGLAIIVGSTLLLAFMLFSNFVLGILYTPMAFFVVLNTFLSGVVLSALGLIAVYIGHIHTEAINRPLYLVREIAGARTPARDVGCTRSGAIHAA